MNTLRKFLALACTFALVASAAAQTADSYPSKPIRWIVPYPAGGLTDRVTRAYATQLQEALGQPVIVDNRAGGNTLIATQAAMNAPADGYTLFTMTPPLVAGPLLYPEGAWPADPLKVFEPVSMFIKVTNVLLVPANSPYTTVQELLAGSKREGKPVFFATASIGTAAHLAALQFGMRTGVEMRAVPYKGAAPMTTDILGGHVGLATDNLAGWISYSKAGKSRVLVILGPDRAAAMPNVPSMKDLGFADFEGAGWQGLGVRAGTPRAIVDRLAREIQRISRTAELKRYEEHGDEIVGSGSEHFTSFIREEMQRSKTMITRFVIKPE